MLTIRQTYKHTERQTERKVKKGLQYKTTTAILFSKK